MAIHARTEEIPRQRWREFLDEFSRRHDGWLVKVQELLADRGAQIEARELPFFGATAELESPGSITLELGGPGTDHLEHRIPAPSRLWVESLEGGAEAALEVESAGDRKTLLSFRSAQLPELVDGLAGHPPGRAGSPVGRGRKADTEDL